MTALRSAILLLAALVAVPAFAQTKPAAPASADTMQVLREKLKADKKLLIAANLELSEAEGKKFWPVYEAYQKELHKINHQIAMVLVDYSKDFNAKTLTDAKASALLDRAIALDEAEVRIKKALVPKVRAVLPGIKATRYVQLENKIRALVKYEIAAEVPLAP
jgi:Spy/CpxP family protein refolding chaperone